MKRQLVVVVVCALATPPSLFGCRQGASVADGGGSGGMAMGGAGGTASTGGAQGSGGGQASGGTQGSGGIPGSGGRGGITGGTGGRMGGTGGSGTGGNAGGTGGANGGTCTYDGMTYQVGASFPDADGCNTCGCAAGGQIACTARVCPPDAGAPPCAFDASYQYGMIGGRVTFQHRINIGPGSSYSHSRYSVPSGPYLSCSPAMPACPSTAIDVSDVMRDLADPDVQKAFVTSPVPIFGIDPRLTDGPIFSCAKFSGGGFQVGNPCAGASGCVEIPAGIARLVATLRALDAQQLKDPSCEALRGDAFVY